ncbi:MAG: four helix bundle protein [Selenomonadaceae bacterium]|nr:four helix bundle protein [Selenomonadaceae bacterium]
MAIINYRDLNVWKKSMDLVVEIYNLVKLFPKYETYGLSDQMRRAAVSIPSNIAEGQGRNSTAEFVRFLNIARGSCAELDTQLEVCIRLEYVNKSDISKVIELCQIVGKMLSAMISKLR